MIDRRSRIVAAALLLTLGVAVPGGGQPPGMEMSVAYTEAIRHDVRQTLELTGTVEAREASVVASEVAGLVVELAAREGTAVRRGQTLARLRPDTARLRLQSAEGQLREAEARLELARSREQRASGLFAEQVISRQELDDAVSEVDAFEGRVTQLEAEVARLRDELERTTIRAPFGGVVVAEHTAVGEWIDAGGPVVEMVDVGDLEVMLEVPERFFGGLAIGTEVEVTIAALAGARLAGEIRAVVPRADARARTFPVKVAISNRDRKVGVGMLARVALPIGAGQPRVLVPKDAIVSQGPRRLVFVIGEDGTVRSVPVQTGGANGVWIAVEGDVDVGDRVVTQGNERLQPGMKVRAQPKEFEQP